jgi:hypothetical protein
MDVTEVRKNTCGHNIFKLLCPVVHKRDDCPIKVVCGRSDNSNSRVYCLVYAGTSDLSLDSRIEVQGVPYHRSCCLLVMHCFATIVV